jgi:hypothetical protein
LADYTIKQSDPRTIKRRVYFTAVNINNMQTRLQASDMFATFTVRIAKNGVGPAGAVAASAPVEIDSTNEKGCFYVELAVADLSTAGYAVLKISNSGGTFTMEPREYTIEIPEASFVTVQAGTLTTSAFTSDRTDATDYWKHSMLIGLTGANAGVGGKKVDAFATTGGLFTLASGIVLPVTPVAGDIFEIVNR